MKVAIIFLDYLRHEHSKAALQSICNAGYAFDLFTIQEKGIANAINIGINKTLNYDAIITCANDICMPDNWLVKMIDTSRAIPNTGMCGIHCVEGKGDLITINDKKIMQSYTAFGNVLIPRKAIDTIGYFNTDYDPYGMQDADYAHRLLNTGFINYYLADESANHIGNDIGNGTEYRKMKDDGLALSNNKWNYWLKKYEHDNNYYLPYNQSINEKPH